MATTAQAQPAQSQPGQKQQQQQQHVQNPEKQRELAQLNERYEGLQGELQNLVSTRQKLSAQQSENEQVQKTLSSSSDSSTIYKNIGPVLHTQTQEEASMAVKGRLDYLNREIERLEGRIKDMKGKGEELGMKIMAVRGEVGGG
ncbi:MAG: hypothetical protein M1831_005232 [Alyxoria varia]|nr:MAG: hypothetical protein M1831_005232 [Alyxoria varia]